MKEPRLPERFTQRDADDLHHAAWHAYEDVASDLFSAYAAEYGGGKIPRIHVRDLIDCIHTQLEMLSGRPKRFHDPDKLLVARDVERLGRKAGELRTGDIAEDVLRAFLRRSIVTTTSKKEEEWASKTVEFYLRGHADKRGYLHA